MTRFYVNTMYLNESKMVASEVHVEYSSDFIQEIANLENAEEFKQKAIDSVDHGKNFEGMFLPDRRH